MNEAGQVVDFHMCLYAGIVDTFHGLLFELSDDLLDRIGHPAMVNEAGTDVTLGVDGCGLGENAIYPHAKTVYALFAPHVVHALHALGRDKPVPITSKSPRASPKREPDHFAGIRECELLPS